MKLSELMSGFTEKDCAKPGTVIIIDDSGLIIEPDDGDELDGWDEFGGEINLSIVTGGVEIESYDNAGGCTILKLAPDEIKEVRDLLDEALEMGDDIYLEDDEDEAENWLDNFAAGLKDEDCIPAGTTIVIDDSGLRTIRPIDGEDEI